MKRLLSVAMGLGIAASLLLSGCASTQMSANWKNPAYSVHPTKVMVVGVSKKAVNRRMFEDEFAAQLKARGVDAVASYTVLSDKKQNDQEAIAAKVKELGADSVLVTRLVSKRTVKVYVPGMPYFPPPYYGRWPDYYGYGYRDLYTPGYMSEEQYAIMETNLYEAATDSLIWAATSETEMSGADIGLIKEYVGIMVNNMAGYGLLNK